MDRNENPGKMTFVFGPLSRAIRRSNERAGAYLAALEAYRELNAIDLSVNQPLATSYVGLSRQRAEWRDAHEQTLAVLDGIVSSLQAHGENLGDSLIEAAGPCWWGNEHNRQILLQILDDRIPVLSETEPPPLKLILFLLLLSAQRLVRRLFNRIRKATQLLSQPIPTPIYCGVSWSRRTWFLLHGSRPPKPELGLPDLMFGCA
jgi:hypothetical protein